MNASPWTYAIVSLVAHVAAVALAVYVVRRKKDATSRRQLLRKIGWIGVVLWTIGGVLWTARGRSLVWLNTLLLPEWLTAWPAHEAALIVSGHGTGANVRTPFIPTAICALVWALVLWSPLLTTRSRTVSVRAAVVLQVLLLGIVGALFLRFGNG